MEKAADHDSGDHELDRGRNASTPVPAAQPMAGEELVAARPREPHHMFEVWTRGRECASHGRVERPTRAGEQQDRGDPGADLEASVPDVLVRHSIAREVEQQAQRKRAKPRAQERPTDRSCRDVKGNDQSAALASSTARTDPLYGAFGSGALVTQVGNSWRHAPATA